MAYDESVAERIRQVLPTEVHVREQKMMGGLIFMVDGHMCCGVAEDGLLVRVGPDAYEQALARPHVAPLDIGGGRKPRAFVRVAPDGFKTKRALRVWTQQGLRFIATLPARKP